MRHGKKFNHLGRKAPHRKAMLANMACSLIQHKRIKTTVAKAKALRIFIEPLLTKSKNDTTHSRRTVFSYLKQKEAITELFGDVAAKIANRPGGYTRILKISNRLGDNSEMCVIELVDYNEAYTTDKPKRKKTRRRRGGKSDEGQIAESTTKEVLTDENAPEGNVEVEDGKADEVASVEPKAVEEKTETEETATEEAEPKAEEEKTETEEVEGDDKDGSNEEKKKEE